MSALMDTYIEELASGHIPARESEEAKDYRAWSWAQAQLAEIKEQAKWDRVAELIGC